jgi:hypothetical protein
MSLRAKVVGVGAVVLALLVAWPVLTHYRAKARVEAHRRQLKATGEKLEISELTPLRSAEAFQNSADLMRVAARLRPSAPSYSNSPPIMAFIAPGKALVCWQQPVLPTDQTPNVWLGLAVEIAQNRGEIEEIGSIVQRSALAFDLDYSKGVEMPLPSLAKVKFLAQWLSVAAIQDLHEGHSSEAWTNLLALSSLVSKDQDQPVLICALVRIAIGAMAVPPMWEALQSSDCTEEQLKRVQASWESLDFLGQTEPAFAMERPWMRAFFEKVRDSYSSAGQGLYQPQAKGGSTLAQMEDKLKAFIHRYPGYWIWSYWGSYDDELAEIGEVQACLEAARQTQKEKRFIPALKKLNQDMARVTQQHPDADKWLGLSGDGGSLKRVFTRVASIEVQRALLITAIALKRYQLLHESYPTSLELLAPAFLRETPRDPMDGQPLRYRLNADGSFLLYSVGENGVDDGGDPTPSPEAQKQWPRARDAVWPQPATPDEVKADFAKLKRR